MKIQLAFAAAASGFMATGLVVRLVKLGLPIVVRHGGNIAWGAMLFCVLAATLVGGTGRPGLVGASSLVTIGSELFRLVHAPALDAFRLTLTGALLIGRSFSIWNMVDYEIGIAAAALLAWPLIMRHRH